MCLLFYTELYLRKAQSELQTSSQLMKCAISDRQSSEDETS